MIRKLVANGDKIEVTLDLTLSKRIFKDLRQARDFLVKYESKICNLIEKLAISRTTFKITEIMSKENKVVVDSLKRLGLL
jgi:hypothetical protein